MKHKGINIFIINLVMTFALLSCNDNNITKEYKIYYENGKLKESYQLKENKKNGLATSYFENGNILAIKMYSYDTLNGQVLLFDSTGYLKEKYESKMGDRNGAAYTFSSEGVIVTYRMWINGKEEGYGEDYYLKDGNTRIYYWFNNDSIMYTKFFDPNGYVYKEEGIHPTLDDMKRYDSLMLKYKPVGKLKAVEINK